MGYGAGAGASSGTFAMHNAVRTGLQAWTITGDVVGVAQSSYNVLNAQESWSDGLGFLPTAGWGAAGLRGVVSTRRLLRAERALGGSHGHQYAEEILEGGSGLAFAGHGQLRPGSGYVTVPAGTSITLPRDGIRISEMTGRFIERGDWDGLFKAASKYDRVAEDIQGMVTYLPGARIPNYTLLAPTKGARPMSIYSRSTTVEDPMTLSQLLEPNMGHCDWAACTERIFR